MLESQHRKPSTNCAVRGDLVIESHHSFPLETLTDCPINGIRKSYRQTTDPTLDSHEPCMQGRCQSLWFPFQSTRWGKAD